jgi:glycosyltransferase involved in cell wall biosynthesis
VAVSYNSLFGAGGADCRPAASSGYRADARAGGPARLPPGISVVIPSRNGRALLAAQLPGIARELTGPSEAIVVDNGSSDGTAQWLASEWPALQVEVSAEPLSFAAAVNRGIGRARYSHVCLLNNDMLLEPGFFRRSVPLSARCRDFSAPPRRSASRRACAARRPARR